jgi:hypothetical protein
MRDPDKEAAYTAEQQVRELMDMAVEVEDWTFDFHGYTMQLPQERKFASLESIRSYVNAVCNLSQVRARFPGRGTPKVAEHDYIDIASYTHHDETINIRTHKDSKWQQRELIVLHELAHHMAKGDGHGPEWRGAFVFLIDECMGRQMAMVMGEQFYAQVGAPFAVK